MRQGSWAGRTVWGVLVATLAASGPAWGANVKKPGPAPKTAPGVKFEIKCLTVDSNEGCAIADVNGDGKPDVIAGRNWYAAPAFIPRPVRLIEDWQSYTGSNGDHVWDVDGDGRPDVIAGGFMDKLVHWYRNPGKVDLQRGRLWPKQLLMDTGAVQNEAQDLHDLDGDGTPEYVVNSWAVKAPLVVWKFAKDAKGQPTMTKIVLGKSGNGHGLGFGDVNGDGREDILVGEGWYEKPADKVLQQEWKLQRDWKWHAPCPMLVKDLDGDGRNDIIQGNAHGFGLVWMRQLPPAGGKTQWQEHVIDASWSQPHCLHFADLDGDGKADLVTGKRVRAHDGKDPGGSLPPCLYYYTQDATTKAFTRHTIDQGRVGGGLQIRSGDLDGDGRVDLAVAGKSGTYVLLNRGK